MLETGRPVWAGGKPEITARARAYLLMTCVSGGAGYAGNILIRKLVKGKESARMCEHLEKKWR